MWSAVTAIERPNAECEVAWQCVDGAGLPLNLQPAGHTRLPAYARGERGTIARVYPGFILPDTNAHLAGENPQRVCAVRFDARGEVPGSVIRAYRVPAPNGTLPQSAAPRAHEVASRARLELSADSRAAEARRYERVLDARRTPSAISTPASCAASAGSGTAASAVSR